MRKIIRFISILIALCTVLGGFVGCVREDSGMDSDCTSEAENFELTLEHLSDYVVGRTI